MHRFVVVLLFMVVPAFAVEPLSSATLLEQCSSTEEAKGQACRSWLHGFIGGAFATRTARLSEAEKKEAFSERAARTRISRGRALYGQNYQAAYCLPVETTIDELVDKLQSHGAGLKQVPEHANQLVLGMLRKHYPCANKPA